LRVNACATCGKELVDALKRDKKVRNGIWLAIRVGVVGSWRRRPIAALGF
jgi:hypothetical protein